MNTASAAPAVLFAALVAPMAADAQTAPDNYPSKPIRLIVPQPPSGTADMLARMIAQRLAETVRQQVVVDSRGGASGTIGSDLVAKAPADGYTVLMTMTSHTTTPSMFAKLPYDAIGDFAPVTMVTSAALMLVVNPVLPVHSLKDLVTYAKAKPGQINFTSAAIGSGGHLGGELLKNMTGIAATHIPYRGTGPAIIAVMANEVQFMFAGLLPAQAQVKVNRLRAIAVTTAKRWPSLPDVAAMAEALPGYEVESWFGIVMPKGVPPAVLERLNAAANKILRDAEVKKNLEGEGMAIVGGSAEQFSRRIRNDHSRWVKLVKDAGLKGE